MQNIISGLAVSSYTIYSAYIIYNAYIIYSAHIVYNAHIIYNADTFSSGRGKKEVKINKWPVSV